MRRTALQLLAVRRTRRTGITVGVYVDPVAPLATVVANIRLAKLLGADDIWMGDHTTAMLPRAAWDPATNPLARIVPNLDAYFDPTALIARYAKRGTRIGTSVTDAVRRSPADLARAWLTLHHVTGGNAILGIGSGEVENTEPYGLSMSRSVSRLDDLLGAVRAAWASNGARIDHQGPFHTWRHATFALPPRKGTYPPIWVAAQGPRACLVAGRWGDGWIHVFEGFEAWRHAQTEMYKGASDAGRDPDAIEQSLVIAGLLVGRPGDLDEAVTKGTIRGAALALRGSAWKQAGASHPFGEDFRGFSEIDPSSMTAETLSDAGRHVTAKVLSGLMPCGSGSEVAEQLAPFVSQGLSHAIVINLAPTCGIGIGARSFREQRELTRLLKSMTKLTV